MITESILFGIACIMTNSPQVDSQNILANLSQEEKIEVQKMVEQKLCVPESLEKILQQGREQLNCGDSRYDKAAFGGQPTFRCA